MNPFMTAGVFSWPELQTNDPAAAAAFYKAVFGWTTETMSIPTGEYTICKVGPAGLAGILKQPQPGAPSYWAFYVTVDDLPAYVEKTKELGGSVILPHLEIATVGTLAVVQDPQGAVVMLMQYDPGDDSQSTDFDFADLAKLHGAFSWFELRTPDTDAAIEFYSKLFGWKIRRDDSGMGPYYMAHVQDIPVAAIINPPVTGVPPHWAGYVTTSDVEETVKRVKANGGNVLIEPMDIPNVGRFAAFRDPTGAMLSAITYVSSES